MRCEYREGSLFVVPTEKGEARSVRRYDLQKAGPGSPFSEYAGELVLARLTEHLELGKVRTDVFSGKRESASINCWAEVVLGRLAVEEERVSVLCPTVSLNGQSMPKIEKRDAELFPALFERLEGLASRPHTIELFVGDEEVRAFVERSFEASYAGMGYPQGNLLVRLFFAGHFQLPPGRMPRFEEMCRTYGHQLAERLERQARSLLAARERHSKAIREVEVAEADRRSFEEELEAFRQYFPGGALARRERETV